MVIMPCTWHVGKVDSDCLSFSFVGISAWLVLLAIFSNVPARGFEADRYFGLTFRLLFPPYVSTSSLVFRGA